MVGERVGEKKLKKLFYKDDLLFILGGFLLLSTPLLIIGLIIFFVFVGMPKETRALEDCERLLSHRECANMMR